MKEKTLQEIHDEGMDVLLKTLGPADTMRFIKMFDPGTGDYTKERRQWLSKDLRRIYLEIQKMQDQE